MTPAERAQLSNKVYDAVFPLLTEYETRGHNAHHAAQRVITLVEAECERWIELVKPKVTHEPDGCGPHGSPLKTS